VLYIPNALLKIERRTTRMARPARTPTIMATDFPTWSSSLEDSTQKIKLHQNNW